MMLQLVSCPCSPLSLMALAWPSLPSSSLQGTGSVSSSPAADGETHSTVGLTWYEVARWLGSQDSSPKLQPWSGPAEQAEIHHFPRTPELKEGSRRL